VIKIEECHERSIMACLKLLLNEKLGLSALYPNNIIHLMSTAEVERVFSPYRYTILWVAFLDPSDSYFLKIPKQNKCRQIYVSPDPLV
jgi:hypothetical protein